MELINKKEFAKVALNKDIEAFFIYVSSLNLRLITIYLAWETQIALLLSKEKIVLTEYVDFADVF